MGEPLDTFKRPLRDLRVSVTDRCNFRCVYCMPKEVFGKDFQFLPRGEILSFEEIERLVRVFVGLGVQKVRLTGGEPLVRRNIERLVEMLAKVSDLDLTLTTNGSLLAGKAKALRDAGLKRVTVSLDSLDDKVFKSMNDVDFPVARVLEGMDAAEAVGLAPIKVNMVVKRGLNEQSILPMARHFRGTGRILRFIEYMDVGSSNGWRLNDVVSAREIVATIDRELPLEPVEKNYPARSRSAGATAMAAARSVSSPRSRRRSAPTARARDSRRTVLCTRACSRRRATISAPSCAVTRPIHRSPIRSPRSGPPATTATPSCARQRPPVSRRSK
jgi:cyclic pyranopterin phosphate synthase